jgi:hypothetical protein
MSENQVILGKLEALATVVELARTVGYFQIVIV